MVEGTLQSPTQTVSHATPALRRSYLEMMQVHVDEGGQLSHRNGLDLLAEVERLNADADRLRALICNMSSDLSDEGASYSEDGLDRTRRAVANALPIEQCPDWLHGYRDADVLAFPSPLISSQRPEGDALFAAQCVTPTTRSQEVG